MAKVGSLYLKGSKGKLAGATLYKQGSDTIIREVVTPNNPKTRAQLLQRIVMNTMAQAYAKMKDIADHSFEGVKKGQATMAYFMKRNVQFCRQQIEQMQAQGVSFYDMYNFVPLGTKGFTPNQYLVSMGSLPEIQTAFDEDDYVKAYVPVIKVNTYAGVCQALGLSRGDQLTFLTIQGNSAKFGQCEFRFARVILDPTDADGLPMSMDTAFLADGHINAPSVRNEGSFASIAIDAEKGLSFRYDVTNPGAGTIAPVIASAVIASRKVGDEWLRSNAWMQYRGNVGICYSLGDALDMAEAGTAAPVYQANEQYLNNAGTGNGTISSDQQGGGGESGGGTDPDPDQGGGVTPGQFEITSASFDGRNLTVGTAQQISLDAWAPGDTKNLVMHFSGTTTDVSVRVKKGATTKATQAISDDAATVAVELEEGTFTVYTVKNDVEQATGYSFTIVENDEEG